VLLPEIGPDCTLEDVFYFKNLSFLTINLTIMLLRSAKRASRLLAAIMLFSTGPLVAQAQTNIAVAPVKLNVFYIGVENPVSVAVAAEKDENVTVTINGGGGRITKTAAGLYNVMVTEVTDDCIISVYAKGKLTGTAGFRVRLLPLPDATVGGFRSGEKVAADVFLSQAGLGVYLANFPFNVWFEVAGYTITVDNDRGDIMTVDVVGSPFSLKVKEFLSKFVKPGRTVTIDNIRIKGSGGLLKIPSLVYYIK
jgi:carbon monoxide dehydrogenase subunit G